ncbi:MAG: rhodanese-like domain-containing protein, partial [Candidatus Cloacimonetes bacterium]|nr:rhodanese-like domain-containing protein [Candidatus Cloacimonadota bacterium]
MKILKFNYLLYSISILLLTLFFTSCSSLKSSKLPAIYEDITSEEALRIIYQHESNNNFVILDVRTPEEIEHGFVENAIFIDYKADSFENKISDLDKNNIYLVYCKAGIRSTKVVEFMEENGFLYLYNIIDGFDGWNKNEFPIEVD